MGCGRWIPGRDGCLACGWEPPAPNRALRVAKLNSHLYGMAEQALAGERAYRRSVGEEIRQARRLGVEPAPLKPGPLTPREAKALAG